MFWEIGNDIRKYIKMTLIPSMRNIFSSVRSLLGMFTVMLILQILLSVICIFGIENIKNQQAVLSDFNQSLASITDIITTDSGSFMTSDTFKTALSSTSIFIGAIIIWGICAITAYQKITFAAADRDKYIWGMYVTHGAKSKKIRAMLKCELYTPHLFATVIAYPLALFICNYSLREHGYSYPHSNLNLIAILAISYICIRLVVAYECFLIRSMSCTEMLKNEDSPKSISPPRKVARLTKGFTAFRYGSSSFSRMRKYYISLALIAAIPAVIWVCFHVSATGEDSFLSNKINEFAVTIKTGISEQKLDEIRNGKLSDIKGISSIEASADYDAAKIYTHFIADKQHFTTTANSPYFTSSYADNSITLCVANRALKQTVGYRMATVKDGTVNIIAPKDSTQYILAEGQKIFIAVSKLDGSIRTSTIDNLAVLEDDLKDDYNYVELKVGNVSYLQSQSLTEDGFLNVTDTYFILSNDDYEEITSLSTDDLTSHIPLRDVTYQSTLSSDASFNITVPLSYITTVPSVGDCVGLGGKYSLNIKLENIPVGGGVSTRTLEKKVRDSVEYAYINSVSISGDSLTLNVTPYDIITLEKGLGALPSIVLALGTPALDNTEIAFFAGSCGNDLTLSGGTIELDCLNVQICASSEIKAAQAGTHLILSEDQLAKKDGRLLLETFYADNSFRLVCADKTTLSSLGIDAATLSKDSNGTILMLPSSAVNYLQFSKGDKLRLAITKEDVVTYDEQGEAQGGSYDTLVLHLESNYFRYVTVYVEDIIYSDDIDKPYVLVGADSFATVIGKVSPYLNLDIIIDAGISNEEYARILEELNSWSINQTFNPSVKSTGNYLDYLLRKNANYSTIITVIGLIVPLIVPFIWYYPIATLFDRRRSELYVLRTIGKSRKTLTASFATEGALVCIAAFLSVILLCYPAMFVFKTICTLCKLPLEFDYSYLSLPALLLAGAFTALCAAISFAVCYVTTASKGRVKKPRRKYGNT